MCPKGTSIRLHEGCVGRRVPPACPPDSAHHRKREALGPVVAEDLRGGPHLRPSEPITLRAERGLRAAGARPQRQGSRGGQGARGHRLPALASRPQREREARHGARLECLPQRPGDAFLEVRVRDALRVQLLHAVPSPLAQLVQVTERDGLGGRPKGKTKCSSLRASLGGEMAFSRHCSSRWVLVKVRRPSCRWPPRTGNELPASHGAVGTYGALHRVGITRARPQTLGTPGCRRPPQPVEVSVLPTDHLQLNTEEGTLGSLSARHVSLLPGFTYYVAEVELRPRLACLVHLPVQRPTCDGAAVGRRQEARKRVLVRRHKP